MNNDLTQWLAEIKSLKQQLADSIRDREAAYESAASWRQLYNTEAQQRRTETRLAREQIEVLNARILQLEGERSQPQSDDPETALAIEQAVTQLATLEELRGKLTEALIERDRLLHALKTEQANHAQTRKSLTAVIGDTIDQLARERGMHPTNLEAKENHT